MFRTIAGLFFLVVAGYTGWLSTHLLDMNNFRTEGSPAGAGLFVVFLCFPPIALASGIAGIVLLVTARRSRETVRAPIRSTPPASPPARVEGRRIRSAEGATLEILEHGELAVVWMRRTDGSGLRSHNSRRHGEVTYLPFRCADGAPVRLPGQWTVPAALARQAAADFESARDWTRRLGTAPTPVVPVELREGDDRSRWAWLIHQP